MPSSITKIGPPEKPFPAHQFFVPKMLGMLHLLKNPNEQVVKVGSLEVDSQRVAGQGKRMKKTLRVLVVEDSDDDMLLLLRELERGGFEPQSKRVETLATFAAALDRNSWDLVISDHNLAGFDSLHALKVFSERKLDIPFIIVSGLIGEEAAVKAMKAGANDYVMKSQLGRLVPAIERECREAAGRGARRRAEEALRRNEQELNDFFEHAPMGLQWLGADGTILRVNQAELDLLGYEREEYAGHSISEFYIEKAVVEDFLQRLHAGKSVNNFEASLRCKDGSIKHVLIDSNVYRENGKFIHSRSFTRDITAQRAAEAAKAYLASIVEFSEDAIIGCALDGTILSWNEGATQMYGFRAEEMKGAAISQLTPAYRPEDWPDICKRLKEGEHITRFESIRQRKDGTRVEVALTLSPIKDDAGRVTGISAIEWDITARKREEEERLKLITELTEALSKIKTLHGLLPICSSCKKIRDDGGYWQKIESYISQRTQAEFTHGICPDCVAKLYPQYALDKGKRPAS